MRCDNHGMSNEVSTFNARLDDIKRHSQSTLEFSLTREDDATVMYEPGQFFRFVFEDDEGEFERSYSLCNRDLAPSAKMDLVISEVDQGRATNVLFNAAPGLTARVTGPYGRLLVPDPLPGRLVMVATSVGIAPFRPMLTALRESLGADNDFQLVLLFGVRDHSEILYRDELLGLDREFDNFTLEICLSRDAPDSPGEFKGYVTERLGNLAPDVESDHFLLCGNPQMIDDVYKPLKSQGFKAKQVTREKYVFAKDTKGESKALTQDQKDLIAAKLAAHKPKS